MGRDGLDAFGGLGVRGVGADAVERIQEYVPGYSGDPKALDKRSHATLVDPRLLLFIGNLKNDELKGAYIDALRIYKRFSNHDENCAFLYDWVVSQLLATASVGGKRAEQLEKILLSQSQPEDGVGGGFTPSVEGEDADGATGLKDV